MPYVIGITGNIACGKTTVGSILLELGAARYIDADAIVHELYHPNQPLYDAVLRDFGPGVLASDGAIDRKALGAIVFNDPIRLKQLEALVHPIVSTTIVGQLMDLGTQEIGIVDAVKLLEGNTAQQCNAIWLITCSPDEERRRLIEDRGLSPDEASKRLAAQPNRDQHDPRITEVIDNSGTRATTKVQVEAAWQRFIARYGLMKS
jgi:dephospho-CoA kinase